MKKSDYFQKGKGFARLLSEITKLKTGFQNYGQDIRITTRRKFVRISLEDKKRRICRNKQAK